MTKKPKTLDQLSPVELDRLTQALSSIRKDVRAGVSLQAAVAHQNKVGTVTKANLPLLWSILEAKLDTLADRTDVSDDLGRACLREEAVKRLKKLSD